MSSYFTCYDYVYDKANKFPGDHACFSTVFSSMLKNSDNLLSELNLYLIRGIDTERYNHSFEFEKEEVSAVFESLSDTIDPPVISTMKVSDIPNFGRYESYIKKDLEVVCLKFDFTGKTKIYVRFVLTLCRYFYEIDGEADYTKIISRYLDSIKKEELKGIPNIELFQLCHSFTHSYGSHGLFGSHSTTEVIPIKKDEFCKRLNSKEMLYLNMSKREGQETLFNTEKMIVKNRLLKFNDDFLIKYLNENTDNRE